MIAVDGLDVHERIVAITEAARARFAHDSVPRTQAKTPNLRDRDRDVLRALRAILRAQEAVAARLYFQHALSGAKQPGLQHPRHNRIARPIFFIVVTERLGFIQADFVLPKHGGT